jgi:cephalosporin hydroxylase
MKITIDTTAKQVSVEDGSERKLPLYSREAFEVLSDIWVKVGWDQKYSYTFTWLGRPIIQLPEDMIRFQEMIFTVKPDVIIETGVAHGGSLILSASLCKLLGKGRVIGVDIEIRPHNRKAIEEHFLSPLITLVEGSSTAPEIVNKVKSLVKPGETAIVILDSNHTKQHVLDELDAYYKFVTPGSYIVAMDGVMKYLADQDRAKPEWTWDNPANAAEEFAAKHPEFQIEQPKWLFSESPLQKNITYGPSAYLKRVR